MLPNLDQDQMDFATQISKLAAEYFEKTGVMYIVSSQNGGDIYLKRQAHLEKEKKD